MTVFMPRDVPKRNLEVGLRLAAARRVLGYDDRKAGEFAENASIKSNAYSQYETGARWIGRDAAIKLCNKYPLTLDFIYRGKLGGLQHDLAEKIEAEYEKLSAKTPEGLKVVSAKRRHAG